MRRRLQGALSLDPPRDHQDELLRFVVVGACGYVLAMVLYAGQIAAGVSAYGAVPLTFVANGLFNFTLNRRWSFGPSGRPVHDELARFGLVALGSLVVNYGTLFVLHGLAGVAAVPAQAVAILVAVPVGFLGNKLFSFAVAERSTP